MIMEEEKTEPPKTTKAKKPAAKGQMSASEESASKYPDMGLCQKIHRLSTKQTTQALNPAEQQAVFDEIAKELENPSLYRSVAEAAKPTGLTLLTEDKLNELDEKHKKTITELEAKVEDAKESAGDMEVMDARMEIARFAAKSLSEKEAMEAYIKLIDLPKISSGKKIDALMETSRVASFYGDIRTSNEYIEKAQKLATEGSGGDWDRRNRLKVYRALSNLLARDVKSSAGLLIDCIATFSCNEICTYKDFIVYTILSNILHIPRPLLKEKIIDGPEILSVATEIPVVLQLTKSLYDCNYKAYLHAMVELEGLLFADRYLFPHAAFWMRELHILAYKQFLDAYQSVTLAAMAKSFGVSTDFIDYHASRFIAAGRLSAKIDKFGGVIVTNRPDLKNAQYRDMIQKGDLLLNRIQKLARVVDV